MPEVERIGDQSDENHGPFGQHDTDRRRQAIVDSPVRPDYQRRAETRRQSREPREGGFRGIREDGAEYEPQSRQREYFAHGTCSQECWSWREEGDDGSHQQFPRAVGKEVKRGLAKMTNTDDAQGKAKGES